MKKIWVLGDAVVDLLPDGEGRLLQCPGGAPANVAVGVARLGGESGFIGRVGDDPFGRFMRQTLIAENVDVDSLSYDAQHRTSTVVVELQSDGERSFTFMVRPSADLFLLPQDLPAFGTGVSGCTPVPLHLAPNSSRTTTFQAMDAVKEAEWTRRLIPISEPISGRTPTFYESALIRRYAKPTWLSCREKS